MWSGCKSSTVFTPSFFITIFDRETAFLQGMRYKIIQRLDATFTEKGDLKSRLFQKYAKNGRFYS
jgi:hypothetical protein